MRDNPNSHSYLLLYRENKEEKPYPLSLKPNATTHPLTNFQPPWLPTSKQTTFLYSPSSCISDRSIRSLFWSIFSGYPLFFWPSLFVTEVSFLASTCLDCLILYFPYLCRTHPFYFHLVFKWRSLKQNHIVSFPPASATSSIDKRAILEPICVKDLRGTKLIVI